VSFDGSGDSHEVSSGGDDDIGAFAVTGETKNPGLGLLLELVKRGEQDPWDIDIVALTDQYLQALDQNLDARDLGKVARLVFYAAALVHLKAQALADKEARLRAEESQAAIDAQMEDLADALRGRYGLLPGDQPLLRPGDGGVAGLMPRDRRPRERGLTLLDLISALRSYDDRLAQAELALAQAPSYDEELVAPECLGTAHQDDLDRDILEVREDLWRLLALDGATLTFDALVAARSTRTRAGAYLALLFLAQDEEVVLEQQTHYGELRVLRGPYFGQVRAGVSHDELEVEPETETPPETFADTGAHPRPVEVVSVAPAPAEEPPRPKRKRRSKAAVEVEAPATVREEEVNA
jgi:segregation and condensation protein A